MGGEADCPYVHSDWAFYSDFLGIWRQCEEKKTQSECRRNLPIRLSKHPTSWRNNEGFNFAASFKKGWKFIISFKKLKLKYIEVMIVNPLWLICASNCRLNRKTILSKHCIIRVLIISYIRGLEATYCILFVPLIKLKRLLNGVALQESVLDWKYDRKCIHSWKTLQCCLSLTFKVVAWIFKSALAGTCKAHRSWKECKFVIK